MTKRDDTNHWSNPEVNKRLKQETIRFHSDRDFTVWLSGCRQLEAVGNEEVDLSELELRMAATKRAIQKHERTLSEAQSLAEEAQKTLQSALDAVDGFEQQVELDQTRVALAAIHRLSASVRDQINDFGSSLSEVGAASRTITLDLEVARAQSQLAAGKCKVSDERDALAGKAQMQMLVEEPVSISTSTPEELVRVDVDVPETHQARRGTI